MKKVIILICILLSTTGCYNKKELNNLAIISGIDISKNKNEYNISLQIINTDEKKENKNKYEIYESSGKSINNAINNITRRIPKQIYETQIELLTLDEKITKQNLKEVLDYFIRNNETRNEFYVLISRRKEKENSILKELYTKDIINIIENNYKNTGLTTLTTLNELIKEYQNKNGKIILPIIEKTNNKDIIISTGILKNNKTIVYLNKKENIVFNFIKNKINNTNITINKNKTKYITIQLIKPKTKIKINKKNNNINLYITGTALITEKNYNIKKENTKIIEKDINIYIKELIKKTIINTNKKYNTDIYGLREIIYKYNNRFYQNNIKNNKNYLNNIKVSVKSKISIINDNNIIGEIYDKKTNN